MKTLISFIFIFLFFTNAFTQSFYPIERNKSRFEAKIRSNSVKQKSKYIFSNSQKLLEEQIAYNKIGQPVLVKNNKNSYASITQYEYDKFGRLSNEKTEALGSNFLKALSTRFPDNNGGFLVPPNSNGGAIIISYQYNEKNQIVNKEIVLNYFGKSASEITGTEKYHIINEYNDEGNFVAAYFLKDDKKQKFKERLIKKDTVQYNFLDPEGKLLAEEIYDVPNKIYLQRKYLLSNPLNEPSFMYYKHFKKDYRLLKEERYIKDADTDNYINRNTYLMYDSHLDLSDIVEMDENNQLIERTRNHYNDKGLLINEVIMSPSNVVLDRTEYIYEYYE